jgi:hypothetical protein
MSQPSDVFSQQMLRSYFRGERGRLNADGARGSGVLSQQIAQTGGALASMVIKKKPHKK